MRTETINPTDIRLRHGIDADRLAEIVAEMETNGWTGRPVVVYVKDDYLYNVTGCHRISAAIECEIDEIPAVVIRPADDDELDAVEFAAANDDIDAADILREIDQEIGDLVEMG